VFEIRYTLIYKEVPPTKEALSMNQPVNQPTNQDIVALTMPIQLVNAILQYLGTKPYLEVRGLVDAVQAEGQPHFKEPPQAAPAVVPAAEPST
jgi:hypothetical protein